jgi:glycosyltransferase involved in cell wall biosynthesis
MRFLPLRWIFALDVKKIRYWEEYFWKRASRVVAMSEPDRKVMQSHVSGLDVSIVPNGVDSQFFTFQKKQLSKEPKILFVGNFKWLQNREAASILVQQIWPIILKKLPTARLWIVGKFPSKAILALQSSKVEVSDTIDDIRQAYRKSDVLLAPIYGPGGTRYKILEAMATGVPVITTPQGIEGLGVADGQEALVRTDSRSLAEATVAILTKRNLYEQLAQQANQLVRRTYSWSAIAQALDTIYESVAHDRNH